MTLPSEAARYFIQRVADALDELGMALPEDIDMQRLQQGETFNLDMPDNQLAKIEVCAGTTLGAERLFSQNAPLEGWHMSLYHTRAGRARVTHIEFNSTRIRLEPASLQKIAQLSEDKNDPLGGRFFSFDLQRYTETYGVPYSDTVIGIDAVYRYAGQMLLLKKVDITDSKHFNVFSRSSAAVAVYEPMGQGALCPAFVGMVPKYIVLPNRIEKINSAYPVRLQVGDTYIARTFAETQYVTHVLEEILKEPFAE